MTYTLACDSVVVINPPIPRLRVPAPGPKVVKVKQPDLGVIIKNPPRLKAKVTKPNSTVVVLPVAGHTGPAGQDGVDFYYRHDQFLPSAGWMVNHNLGRRPNVGVTIDGSDEVVYVSPVHQPGDNSLYIGFATPHTGTVICS